MGGFFRNPLGIPGQDIILRISYFIWVGLGSIIIEFGIPGKKI
jgi:hypothetical protein